jgi:hypothetical protein
MSGYVISLCPFYIRESNKSITCEGYLADNTFNTTKFESEKKKYDYQRVYCWRESWCCCVLAKTLNKKYE